MLPTSFLAEALRNFTMFVFQQKKTPNNKTPTVATTPFLPRFWLVPPSPPTNRHVWFIENPRSITNSPQRVSGLGIVANKAAQIFPKKKSGKTWEFSPVVCHLMTSLGRNPPWNGCLEHDSFPIGARPIFQGILVSFREGFCKQKNTETFQPADSCFFFGFFFSELGTP